MRTSTILGKNCAGKVNFRSGNQILVKYVCGKAYIFKVSRGFNFSLKNEETFKASRGFNFFLNSEE